MIRDLRRSDLGGFQIVRLFEKSQTLFVLFTPCRFAQRFQVYLELRIVSMFEMLFYKCFQVDFKFCVSSLFFNCYVSSRVKRFDCSFELLLLLCCHAAHAQSQCQR